MAILLLITERQANTNIQFVGDVVGVFDDKHPFTDHEKSTFEFMPVKGSASEVREKLYSQIPYETMKAVGRPKFMLTIANLTAPEKAVLKNTDVGETSVDSVVAKMVKDTSYLDTSNSAWQPSIP